LAPAGGVLAVPAFSATWSPALSAARSAAVMRADGAGSPADGPAATAPGTARAPTTAVTASKDRFRRMRSPTRCGMCGYPPQQATGTLLKVDRIEQIFR
jgi:hypothetical protein